MTGGQARIQTSSETTNVGSHAGRRGCSDGAVIINNTTLGVPVQIQDQPLAAGYVWDDVEHAELRVEGKQV